MKILMVDDEPDAEELFRQNFRREIRRKICTFAFARSGAEALRMMQDGDPPGILLVLSDINMPGMSGIELLGRIKADWPDMPVFMITAYGDDATERRAQEAGATRFLTKPVDFAALKQELSQYLEGTSS